MKTTLLLSLLLALPAAADPLVTSWRTDLSGRYARLYETTADEDALNSVTTWSRGQGVQAQPTYAGVSEVATTATDVYLRATGLGAHIMGPWYLNEAKTNLFPNFPSNGAVLYRLPRDPGPVPAIKSPTGLGRIGLFVDGVSMFDTRDAFSYDTSAGQDDGPMAGGGVNGDDAWNRDAYVNEGVTFDAGNAHQAGPNHHYHANPPGLRHLLGDSVDYHEPTNTYTESFNGEHSPILGWVRDGYPIYGPYGYSDPNDPDSPVALMRSGYQKRSITERRTLPAHAARDQGYTSAGDTAEYSLPETLFGPVVTAGAGSQYELGHYLEDYEYLGDLGQVHGADFDLDLHNGRFCVTPEFPTGTYAYFVSIEEDGTPKFPYNIGRTYYGTPSGNTAAAVPAGAEIVFEGGPEKGIQNGEVITDNSNGDVTVTWSAVEGGTYVIERSEDLKAWVGMAGNMDRDQLYAPDPAALNNRPRQFYRSSLIDVAPFDDSGFDVDLDFGPAGGNNVLLLLIDDWGIDWSPVDNPEGAQLPDMPNLQWLADNGVRFTNAYAQPSCSPTRATLLTGRHPFRHGVGTPAGANLPADEIALPEAFADAGSSYALGSIGKWHLGGGDDGPSTRGGWPSFSGVTAGNIDDYWAWDKTVDGMLTPVTDTYATTDQIDDALTFVASAGASPWFCWVGFNAPHDPFHDPPMELLPEGTADPADNQDRYEQSLEALDFEIGRLLDNIDLSKTNVILVGDNGTPSQVAQAPFARGRVKGTLYEGGLRVPMVAAGPDVVARGTNHSPVHVVDLYATILTLAGINLEDALPAGTMLDSRDLYPALIGGQVDGCVVSETFGNQIENPGRAIRDGDYKLIIFDDPEITTDTPRFEMYDVANYLSEEVELLGQPGGLTAEQMAAYDALLAKSDTLGGGFGDTGSGGGDMPVSSGILNVSPATAAAGTTLTVTFTFDDTWTPPVPPLNNMAGNPITPTVTLGGITGTGVNRLSRYVLQATFTLPAGAGMLDAQATFPGPNMLMYGRTLAFEVTP
ncbi:MAG: sulfatase-like hydrolase/transferase [Verrucomicrobiales bacterium]